MTSNNCFINVGIDSIGFYSPRYFLDLQDLAEIRKIDPNKIKHGLLLKEMRIPEIGEDIVTMGCKAGYNAITRGNINPKTIEALFVGTETATYAVKSVSNILAEILGISTNSITQDIYNACAGGSLAVMNAISMVQTGLIKKALVIGADICTYDLNSPGEPTQGAGAIGLIISRNPRIACFSKKFGKFSANINDFYRPIGKDTPNVFGKYSVDSYLKFQMGAFDDLYKNLGDFHADYYVFHAPFSKMPLNFIKRLIIERSDHFVNYILNSEPKPPRSRLTDKLPSIRYSLKHFPSIFTGLLLEKGFSRKIISLVREKLEKVFGSYIFPQLNIPRYFGNLYSASVFAQLMYIFENSAKPNDILYFGSYGSGSTCLSGLLKIMPRIQEVVLKEPTIESYMKRKVRKTVEEYEQLKNGTITPTVNLGTITPHENNNERGIELHFCNEGCLIPNIDGLNHCPKGHDGNIKKFFPLYAVLNSKLIETSYEDISFISNGNVKIIGNPKIHSKLEFDLRRVKNYQNSCDLGDGLLNWSPFYIPIQQVQ
jgi:3-hydroxy-3-methylglutaryl CoA synthase